MPLDFTLAGKAYRPVTATADPASIEQYAAAAGDSAPAYRAGPGQIAPPLFPVTAGLPLMMEMVSDPDLGVANPLRILHGGQEMVWHRPLRGGEEIVYTPMLQSVEDKGEGAVFVAAVHGTTPGGEPVVDQYWTIFVRGGGSGADRPRRERPAPLSRGEIADAFTRRVDEGMPARYAAASGDHNPIHLDDGVARAVGLPGVINHGLGTCALVTGGLVAGVLGGDPARVRRLAARFTGMVHPGEDVTTTVWEDAGDGYPFETVTSDGTVVMTGTIEPREQ